MSYLPYVLPDSRLSVIRNYLLAAYGRVASEKAGIPEEFNELATAMRRHGGLLGALAEKTTLWFNMIWGDDQRRARLPDLPWPVTLHADTGSSRRLPDGSRWERLVTPRYTCDIDELTGEKLTVFFAAPVEMAHEIKSKTERALARAGSVAVRLHQTPVRLYLQCSGYMLEGFSWGEYAGVVGEYVVPIGTLSCKRIDE